MPYATEKLRDYLRSPEGQAKIKAGKSIGNSYAGLADILDNKGFSPEQRAIYSNILNRNLGLQAEQAGLGLGRKAAAQGISGTGLANAGLGQVQSGLLAAQQQGEQGINEAGFRAYQQALQTGLGLAEAERQRQFEKSQQPGFFESLVSNALPVAGYAFGNMLSSREFKTDIKPMDTRALLDAVEKLDVKKFRYKPGIEDGGAQEQMGVIAEDTPTPIASTDHKSVDMSQLLMALVGAVQSLSSDLDLVRKFAGSVKEIRKIESGQYA